MSGGEAYRSKVRRGITACREGNVNPWWMLALAFGAEMIVAGCLFVVAGLLPGAAAVIVYGAFLYILLYDLRFVAVYVSVMREPVVEAAPEPEDE